MSAHVITTSEAKVLRVLNEQDGSSPFELASGARLTTSEVNEAVSHLVDKRLAERSGNFVKLTFEGQNVRRRLTPTRSRGGSLSADELVRVIPDSRDRSSDPTDSLDSASLDAALEAEIGRWRNR